MNIEFAKVEHSKRLSEIVLAASEELRGIDFNEEGWERFVNSNTTSEFEAKLSKSEFSIYCCVESNCIIGFLSLKDNEKIDNIMLKSNFSFKLLILRKVFAMFVYIC